MQLLNGTVRSKNCFKTKIVLRISTPFYFNVNVFYIKNVIYCVFYFISDSYIVVKNELGIVYCTFLKFI